MEEMCLWRWFESHRALTASGQSFCLLLVDGTESSLCPASANSHVFHALWNHKLNS